eukprot:jgi/Tetstr1/427474/TSEL_001772.t1
MDDAANEVKEAKKRNELLLVACSQGLLADAEQLIAMGASPSAAKDKQGAAALHFAAGGGHLPLCRLLISKGAEVECEDGTGRTPLHIAASGGHAEVVRYLLDKGAWVDAYDGADATPLHYAARYAPPPCVEALLGGGAKPALRDARDMPPLGEALLRGRMEVAQLLAKAGGALEAERCRGYTLLHLAAASGRTDAVKYLIERGADVNALSDNGLSPLHCAAAEGKLEAAHALLSSGADPHARSQDGTLAEEMVPEPASSDSADALKAETLLRLLQKAGKSRPAAAIKTVPGAGAAATTSFASLPREEQARKVRNWASWPEERLARTANLNPEALRRVAEVRRTAGLLATHSGLLALHTDAAFQADAQLPRVLAAIEAVRLDPSKLNTYKDDPTAMAVIMKLKRFQDLLRSHGHMQPINLTDLVIKAPAQLEETQRRQGALQAGEARAVAAAVAAASCVGEDAAREAAGQAERAEPAGPAKGAEVAANDGAAVAAVAEVAEAEVEGLAESPWWQLARTVLIALLSYALASFITERVALGPDDAEGPPPPPPPPPPMDHDANFEL